MRLYKHGKSALLLKDMIPVMLFNLIFENLILHTFVIIIIIIRCSVMFRVPCFIRRPSEKQLMTLRSRDDVLVLFSLHHSASAFKSPAGIVVQ